MVQSYKFSDKPVFLRLAKDTARPEIVFLPRQQAEKYGLPARAAAALIHVDPFRSDALNELAAKHYLTKREAALVEQILRHSDLRQAGDAIGVSYETARSYLKRIFEKVGCSTQAELVARVISSPSSLLRKAPPTDPNKQIRQIIRLSSGRNMEAFILGPKTGFVVVCFASNIEAVLDVLNETETYQRNLEKLGVRIVMPQWPGAYRSDPAGEDYHQVGFASDVVEIVSQLGAKKFSILSTGFSTDEALRIAHDFPDKVQKVILASAHNSTVADTQRQDSDPLFALTNLLVRKSHRLGIALLGLMWRQIAQDPSKKAKSIARSSDCKSDKDLFMSPEMAAREQKLLALRIAQGFKGQIHRATVRIRPRSFRLDQIETPVEIFQSDNERVTPLDNARVLANDLKNCEFHILHDAGHAHIFRNWPWLVARAAGANILPGAITASYPIDLTGKSAPLKIETSQPPTR